LIDSSFIFCLQETEQCLTNTAQQQIIKDRTIKALAFIAYYRTQRATGALQSIRDYTQKIGQVKADFTVSRNIL